jgi:hypothetical protein
MTDTTATDPRQTADAIPTGRGQTVTDLPTAGSVTLIEHMQEEIGYLRTELAKRSQELATERERSDVLQREALGRIEALTAGGTTPPSTPSEAPGSPKSDGQPAQGLSHTQGVVASVGGLVGRAFDG